MSKKAEREKTENTGKTGKAGKTGETGKARKTGETGKAGRTGKTVKAGETGNAGKTGETVKAGKAGKARKTGKTGRGVCIRLDKLLAREGLGTRSELGRAIRKGRVSVNGTAVKDAGLRVSEEDEILFDGKAVRQENYVYYMLHKPAGVISATEDSRAQTVLDLLRKPFPNPLPAGTQSAGAEAGEYVAEAVLKGAGKPGAESVLTGAERPGAESVLTGAERPGAEAVSAENAKSEGDAVLMEAVLRRGLFPVGRLDKDTEGLLLITDDGQLAHRLLAPGKHVDKTYYAIVTGQVNDEDVQAFARGLEVDEEFTAMPARLCTDPEADTVFFGLIPRDIRAKISPEITQYSQTLVTIKEGKYHQIKRMFAARGKEVLYLKRLSMGSLILDRSLLPGQFRPLTQEELELLL